LAIRVEIVGGFVHSIDSMRKIPLVNVYGDGRAVTQGAQILIFPPPALPNVLMRQLPSDSVSKLIDLVKAAGVGANPDVGRPRVADAPSTRFTVRDAGETKVLDVYALGHADDEAFGLTPEQIANRAALRNLVAALTNLPETLGSEGAGKEEQYVPTRLAAVVSPWSANPEVEGAQRAVGWPGPLPGEPFAAPDLTCVSVSGDQMAKALDAAKSANALTPWVSSYGRWNIALRPLLPDEADCAAIAQSR
jgi:hypothetical protein